MTPLEDTLRAALRQTGDEIPADPPPLRLPARRRPGSRRGWITRGAPLAAAVMVIAVVAAALAVARGVPGHRSAPAQTGATGVPPYYVALTSRQANPGEYAFVATAAEVRVTATGAVLATVAVPRPYVSFTAVTAAADDRTFVLSATEANLPALTQQQLSRDYPHGYVPPQRFFLLRIDPRGATRSGRASLQPLPAWFIPAQNELHAMALSPDGTELAADIGGGAGSYAGRLHLFNLASGTERTWNSEFGLGFAGVDVDELSWTADGRQLAFVTGPASLPGSAVRLLDVAAPGASLLADSRPVVGWMGGRGWQGTWRGAMVTPDGRTVVVIEGLKSDVPGQDREALFKCSIATGTATCGLAGILFGSSGFQQILYANATGSILVVSRARPGNTAGILTGNGGILTRNGYTPLKWSPYIVTAAW